MLPVMPLAEEHITWKNGVVLNALVGKNGQYYTLWFETVYPREEYEYFGNGSDWDDANEFCEQTQMSPALCSSVNGINKLVQAEHKGADRVRFKVVGNHVEAHKVKGA